MSDTGTTFDTVTAGDTAEQVDDFIRALYDPDDIIEFRCIKPVERADSIVRHFWSRADAAGRLIPQLLKLNAEGFHVYVGVNPRPGVGQTGDKSIKFARNAFADIEEITPDEAVRRWESIGLPAPTLVLNSGHGAHIYRRLESPVDDLPAWRELQRDLAVAIGGDTKVQNPERIMRLPGFKNWKAPVALSELVSADTATPHTSTFEEVRASSFDLKRTNRCG